MVDLAPRETDLVATLGATLPGTSWQRSRTHYAANLMAVCPMAFLGGVNPLLYSVYDQPDAGSVPLRL